MSPVVQLPVKVGVVSPVMLSVVDVPVSDAVSRSGADPGVDAAVVSRMITSAGVLCADSLPATSVVVAVMLWVPSVNVDVVKVIGEELQTPVATEVEVLS